MHQEHYINLVMDQPQSLTVADQHCQQTLCLFQTALSNRNNEAEMGSLHEAIRSFDCHDKMEQEMHR
jgi:hypothetical protein